VHTNAHELTRCIHSSILPNTPQAPDLKDLKISMPKKKERVEGAPFGRVQMHGCKVKQSGKKLKLTNCSQIKIFKDSTESVENVTFNLEFETEDEAYSWVSSMVYGGAEKLE
jgi:hypothetical protein